MPDFSEAFVLTAFLPAVPLNGISEIQAHGILRKAPHAAGRLGSVPRISGSRARNLVLRGLLACTDRLHVSDDPALEDDHRAF